MIKDKKLIVISGTPGVGKSTYAKILEKKFDFTRLKLHNYYREISSSYNHTKQCYDVDLKKFIQLVKNKIKDSKKGLIVDSHISHLLPKKIVNLCIILTCENLKMLEQRLKKRKYTKKKVRENIDSEIFQICLTEAKEKKHKIIIFDTSKKLDKKEIILKIKRMI